MSEPLFTPNGIVPTDEQLAIQLARKRHIVIEANAGAAKTTTLALRLAQALARGAEPERVLALTYTDTAVQALKDALARIGLDVATRRHLRVMTFEAFCTERLRAIEGSPVPRHTLPEQLRPHVLQAIARVLGNADERFPDEFTIQGDGTASVEGLLAAFMQLKGSLWLQTELDQRTLTPTLAHTLGQDYTTLKVLRAYEHIRRGGHPDHHAFRAEHDATHDLACLLLDEDAPLDDGADTGHPLDLGLHLVLVDEMHDTNRAMFTVLRALLARNPAAFVGVGDRDQVIHAVAGADVRFMGEAFDREVGVATRFALSTTWRFGRTLAQAVSRLAQHKAYATAPGLSTEVEAIAVVGPADRNWHLSRLITERVGLDPKAPASAIAILLRHPHQSVEIENHLLDKGIDYRTTGFDSYLSRPEVLFVRGLYACAHGCFEGIERTETRQAVLRALLTFAGAFVDTGEAAPDQPIDTAERAQAEAEAFKAVCAQPQLAESFLNHQVLRNGHPAAVRCIERALAVLQHPDPLMVMDGFVAALRPRELASRLLVRQQDIAQVEANITSLIASAGGFDNTASFFRAMNEREIRRLAMNPQRCVLISSIEAAKGLEFEHVIVPGLDRGEFAVGGDTVDNRNLLYVAMTRARRRLTLLHDGGRPSAYLQTLGLL